MKRYKKKWSSAGEKQVSTMLLLWASFLVVLHLDGRIQRIFPTKAWNSHKRHVQESAQKFWCFLFGVPLLLIVVVFTENFLKQQGKNLKIEEICPFQLSWFSIYCSITKSEFLKLFETFAIIAAFLIYWFDRGERRDQAIREDWSLIDGARGCQTSGARLRAIERLYLEKESLKGLDAANADLRGLELEDADLECANFQESDFRQATLNGARLCGSNLRGTNLENVDCVGTDFWEADLRQARLRKANLRSSRLSAVKFHGADLRKADLTSADCRGSRFCEAKIRGAILNSANLKLALFKDVDFNNVDLRNADIRKTSFIRPKNLTLEQIRVATNWRQAIFSSDFYPDSTDLTRETKDSLTSDESDGSDESTELLKMQKRVRFIEDLIEEIRSDKIYTIEDLKDRLTEAPFPFPEISTLRESLLHLEDLSDNANDEITNLIDDLARATLETVEKNQ
jgi:BTB/POZ domain-containing protein KCTD9